MNHITRLSLLAMTIAALAACGGGGGNSTPAPVPAPAPAPIAPTPPAPSPSPAPAPSAAGDCVGNTALLTVGNTYEIEFAGTARSGSTSGNIRYGVKSTVVRNTNFKGNNAIETRTETTFIDSLAGLPAAGATVSSLSYSQIQGAEILSYGASSRFAQSGFLFDNVTSYTPAIRSFINWSAGQSLTQTYTSTSEFVGSPVAISPTVTTTTVSTRLLGRETITVPAGTFDACRFETTTNGAVTLNWSAATGRYAGMPLKTQDNTTGDAVQATRLLFNGS